MANATDVAKFFLSLDEDHLFDDDTLVEMNGRRLYKGNARLNKYLQLSQNVFIAKYGKLLFPETVYAYDNGGVVREVQENYRVIISNPIMEDVFDKDTEVFLKRMYITLKNATLDDLIQISHEDPAWIEKHNYYRLSDQKMMPMAFINDYRERYKDVLILMEKMAV